MLSTRSQDPTGSTDGPPTLVAKDSPVVRSRKRKARHEVDLNSSRLDKKRRHSAAATGNDTGPIDSISTDVNDQTRLDTNAEKILGVRVSGRPGEGDVTQRGINVASVKEAEGPKNSVRSRVSQTDLTSNLETHDSSQNDAGTIKATKAIHKRFGSEEMDLESLQLDSNKAPEIQIQKASEEIVASHSNEASDDEAPETVTAVTGFNRARAAAANAAKTIERYGVLDVFLLGSCLIYSRKEAAKKQKRKERDARLNLQAKSSRKRGIIEADQPKTSLKSKNNVTENVPVRDEGHPQVPQSPDTSLPTFLPESILLAEPPIPLPNLPSNMSSSKKAPKNTLAGKRKLLDRINKPPKDVKHGSRTIRVLKVDGGGLPPRASQQSKALREAWLAGCRGGSLGERGSVPRRKVGGGFVRK